MLLVSYERPAGLAGLILCPPNCDPQISYKYQCKSMRTSTYYTSTNVHVHRRMHLHLHMYMYGCKSQIQMYEHIRAAYMHTCTHTYIYTYTKIHTYTYTNLKRMHACTHTHTNQIPLNQSILASLVECPRQQCLFRLNEIMQNQNEVWFDGDPFQNSTDSAGTGTKDTVRPCQVPMYSVEFILSCE